MPETGIFLACSQRCLRAHLRARHGRAGRSTSVERALAFQVQVNRLGAGDAWSVYQGHRERLTRLLLAAQRGAGLCVLGAGNGTDLDLPALMGAFGEVHLVDIDAEAVGRARARLPAQLRDRVVAHAPVDLAGCLDRLDEWGDGLPGPEALDAFTRSVPEAIARRLGRHFDVVLSSCLLSQLCHPFQNALALPGPEWHRLFSAITRLHLGTLVSLTRPGGTGVIACDVLSHAGPALADLCLRLARPALEAALIERIGSRALAPDPDPQALVAALGSDPLAASVACTWVTDPWLWDLGTTVQLVYGVLFRRE